MDASLRAALLGVVVLLAPSPAAGAPHDEAPVAPPVAWRDPSPVARMFLQLPFERPDTIGNRRVGLDLELLYSNTLLIGRSPSLTLDVSVETAQPTLLVRYGLGSRVELQLGVPGIVDYVGWLTRPIKFVEGLFDSLNPERIGPPPREAHFRLTRADGSGIAWVGTDRGGQGDLWAGAKVLLSDRQEGRRPVLAARAAVKFPTGTPPYGSGTYDVAAGLLAAWQWGATALRVEVDLSIPMGDLTPVHLRTRPYGSVNLGLAHRLGSRVALHLQASSHVSPISGTGLEPVDATTHYVLGGITVDITRSVSLDFGVAENVWSPRSGADITGSFGVNARF